MKVQINKNMGCSVSFIQQPLKKIETEIFDKASILKATLALELPVIPSADLAILDPLVRPGNAAVRLT
jgi:hypothetical protein